MKSSIAGLAVLTVLAGPIYGGPQAASYSQAAPPPASIKWTGFYLGAFGGYMHGQAEPELTLSGAFNQIGPLKSALETRGSEEFNYDGGEAGGLIGYNYQLGNMVIGLEGTGSYLWGRKSTDAGAFVLGPGVPPLDIRTSLKTHYLSTVAPRIGYAWGRLMPYVTGGLAVGDLEFSQTIHDLADQATRLGATRTQSNAGWMAGAGLQYAFTDHWSTRLQYQYVDLGSAGFDTVLTTDARFRGHHEISMTEHHATVALIYQF